MEKSFKKLQASPFFLPLQSNTQVDRAVWADHGSSSEIAETLRLEQVRAKLTERQELVYLSLKNVSKLLKACLLLL